MTNESFIAIVGVISAFSGYFVKDFLNKKKAINSKNDEIKREIDREFIALALSLINPQNNENIKKHNKKPINVVGILYKIYERSVLYSSEDVINAMGDFMQYIYKHPIDPSATEKARNKYAADVIRNLSRVVFYMRKELGLSNNNLGNDGEKVFRSMFTDFDQLLGH